MKEVQKLFLFFSSLLPAVPRGAGGREPVGDGTLEYQLLQRISYAALWVPRAQTTWTVKKFSRVSWITTKLLLWAFHDNHVVNIAATRCAAFFRRQALFRQTALPGEINGTQPPFCDNHWTAGLAYETGG
jgi:hypothetical protein